jgi:nitrate/TMAO reductase-like tetraheme cytochrome c subunit
MKLLGLDLHTTEQKLKIFIIVAGLVMISGISSVVAIQVTSTPQFCSRCHEMQPEYVTWLSSAHNTVACTKCHIEPGAVNLFKHKLTAMKQLYFHFTNSYVTPIELPEPIKNGVCLECHSPNRIVSPSGDLSFPHQKHIAEKLACVQCHSGVVHGNIEQRGFTTATDYASWTPGMGKAYMKPDFTRTKMENCVECHESRDVPVTCNTCHTKLVSPPSHQSGWMQQHGKQAQNNFQACDKCHSKTGSWVVNSKDPGVKGYLRNNTFCLNCHAKNKPPGHTEDWRNIHGPQANANSSGCLACHLENRVPQSVKGTVPESSCAKCHSKPMHQGFVEQNRHPFSLKGKQINASCISCHPQNLCSNCHYIGPAAKR